ncbi:methyltransferase [Priestia megaterium]|uniref:methyltransferase n=1 Tax=Priestia megaterium TaxID=1404 RepID=UPI00203B3774|nr:methyltransferase [Priestia megaterium]MCM3195132.1 SAM-dependent methyltransferase [Priestia megaterium]
MNEQYYDALLNIKTTGEQKGFNNSFHYHRYEPTPYRALETLFTQYELTSSDRIVDFGCGKGRLNFYVNYLCNATAVGIEMNEHFYEQAIDNQRRYLKKAKGRKHPIHFQCCLAQEYKIHPLDTCFYFFNPFSVQIFIQVVNNILLSWEENKREIDLILYYSSEDYLHHLEKHPSFILKEEVMLPELDCKNPYERFLIYKVAY